MIVLCKRHDPAKPALQPGTLSAHRSYSRSRYRKTAQMDASQDIKTPEQTLELAAERVVLTRVRKDWNRVVVRTETVVTEDVLTPDLAGCDVSVTRIPINRDVDIAPETRVEGDVTIIPVLEERLVVTRQLVLIEEIHVRQSRLTRTSELPVSLRHQRAIVERLDAATGTLVSQHILSTKELDHD